MNGFSWCMKFVECFLLIYFLLLYLNIKDKRRIVVLITIEVTLLLITKQGIFDRNNYMYLNWLLVILLLNNKNSMECLFTVSLPYFLSSVIYGGIIIFVNFFHPVLQSGILYFETTEGMILIGVSKIIFFFILTGIIAVRKKWNQQLTNKIYFLMWIITIIVVGLFSELEFYLVDNWKLNNSLMTMGFYLIILAVVVLILLFVFQYEHRMVRRINLEKETMKDEINSYKDIESANNETIKLKHDMKYSLQYVLNLINENKLEDAKKYLVETEDSISKIETKILSKNPLLNMILSKYKKIASEQDIEMISIVAIDEIKMDELDFFKMISNLLDNAIEYGKDEIKFEIVQTHSYMRIRIKNKIGKPLVVKDKHMHGKGLVNVQEITKRYNGEYKVNNDNEDYEVLILIPMD